MDYFLGAFCPCVPHGSKPNLSTCVYKFGFRSCQRGPSADVGWRRTQHKSIYLTILLSDTSSREAAFSSNSMRHIDGMVRIKKDSKDYESLYCL